MQSVEAYSIEVFADYHQFYIWDSGLEIERCLDFTDLDCIRMVKVEPNQVIIQPVRNMDVPVDLELWDTDPGFDEASWDHIAECDLDLPTGNLQVHECTGGPKLDLKVNPGSYRVRALFSGLGTLSEDALDGDDRYKLVLWPGTPQDLRIIKQWRE
jgi:hypothetical protein